MDRTARPHDQFAVLRDRCEDVWPGKGPDRVRKAIALLLLTQAPKEGHQLRLHVLGHMLNIQLGRDWKHKYGVDTPLTQFLQSAPFKVVPTDIPNVDAVRLDVQQLLSLQKPQEPAANAHKAGGTSSKVWVVAKPSTATVDGPPNAHAATAVTAALRPIISTISSSNGLGSSPKAAGDKGAAVLAYINTMRWHEHPQINMLRQALASNIVRKATGSDGRIAELTESRQYCISAAHAASVVNRAWHGRFSAVPNPYSDLQELLAGDTFLHLLPAANTAANSTSGSSSTSNTSHNAEPKVQLDIQLLVGRMAGKGLISNGSPAAPQTPTPAGAKLVVSSTAASLNAAGEAAAAKLIGLLSGKAGKPAATAVSSRAIGAAVAATAASAAAAVAAERSQTCAEVTADVNNLAAAQQEQQQGQEKNLHKKHLLNYIQRRQWDCGVDYNLMKRAVATFLVNKAADGTQVCSLKPVSIHVAKAGEVFHMVWTGRHGPATKPYKKVADVLGNEPFLTIIDGPQHARQLVQLDIKAMAVAAGCIAGSEPAEAVQVARTESVGRDEASVAAEALQQTALQVDAGSSGFSTAGDPAAESGPADADSVEARAQDGSLLALDLLAFAASVTWHDSNLGLALLRQQLAVMMIEAAHPGLAEAVAAGEQVTASADAAQYVMSPYAAGSALMAIWQAKCPDQPKPYTTLPSALEGCKYLVLKLAANGYQAQLNLQRYKQDCRAAMQQMQSAWHGLIESSAAALAAHALSSTSKPAAGGSAAVGAANSSNSPKLLQMTESNSSQPIAQGSDTTQGPPSSPSRSASSSGVGHDSCANAAAGHAPGPSKHDAGLQQLQIPNLQQLLSLLSCAPPGVCQHAGVVWVPGAVQHLMFTEQDRTTTIQDSTHSSQRHAAAAWAFDGGYQLYGIQKLQDATGVDHMLDHLLACPILAVGCCVAHIQATPAPSGPTVPRGSADGAGSAPATVATTKQHQLLLHVLAPPVVGRDSGSVLDASVYVFEVTRHKQSQQQQNSAAGGHDKLQLLFSILLEDAHVVKLVDSHHVLQVLQEYYGIKAAGVLGLNMLESLLGASEVLDALTEGLVDVGGLEGYVAAYRITAGQLESSHNILRSLSQQGCPEGKPISAELITTAASTVRPLMPLALSMLQLLPMALMRRCMLGGVVQ